MKSSIQFEVPKPENYTSYGSEEVKGIPFRVGNALAFTYGQEQWLEMVLDPSNPHHGNAIRIYGHYLDRSGQRCCILIGYVSRDTADDLTKKGLHLYAKPLLTSIWHGGYERDVFYIRYKMIVPTKDALRRSSPPINKTVGRGLPRSYREFPPQRDYIGDAIKAVGLTLFAFGKVAGIAFCHLAIICGTLFMHAGHGLNWLFDQSIGDLIHYDERKPSVVKLLTSLLAFAAVATALLIGGIMLFNR